jgi:hypothetical protein
MITIRFGFQKGFENFDFKKNKKSLNTKARCEYTYIYKIDLQSANFHKFENN